MRGTLFYTCRSSVPAARAQARPAQTGRPSTTSYPYTSTTPKPCTHASQISAPPTTALLTKAPRLVTAWGRVASAPHAAAAEARSIASRVWRVMARCKGLARARGYSVNVVCVALLR